MLQHVGLARRQELTARNQKLIMATCWADCNPSDSIDPYQLRIPGGDRPIHPGGDGTPEMAGFAVAEFGTELGLSIPSTERFIADALDLRHRLPCIWTRVCANEIEGFHAQLIARETHHLTLQQAMTVDREVAAEIGRLAFSRVMNHVRAIIIKVDAERIKRLAEQAKAEVGVFVGQTDEHGHKTVVARTEAAAAIWFDAMVARIADILRRRGHTGSINQRRSDAFAHLGNPAFALRLLAEDEAPSLFDPDLNDDSLLPTHGGPARPSTTDDSVAPEPSSDRGGDDNSDHGGLGSAPADDSETVAEQLCQDARVTLPSGDPSAFTCTDQSPRYPDFDHNLHLAAAAIKAIRAIDPAKLLPKATLYVHVAMETLQSGLGVTRIEDVGPIISSQAADWLRGCQITVKPVIDLNAEHVPVDSYEIPRVMRERVFLRHPGSMFPYSGSVGRHLDQDHAIPYQQGIPGQTGDDKVAPLGRREHRPVTHGPWRRRMPEPGTLVFLISARQSRPRRPDGHP